MQSFLICFIILMVLKSHYSFKNSFLKSKLSKNRISKLYVVKIALTRELGMNNQLKDLLSDFQCIELPCVGFAPGPDTDSLPKELLKYDIIVITSPQAAEVFLNAWNIAGKPNVKIVTVGKGTSKPLILEGLIPVFEPSQATAETLAAELSLDLGTSVLYPSSSLAENTLQDTLTLRGFTVKRLKTYETIPFIWTDDQYKQAENIKIVTFASPSAIRIWSERCGTDAIAVVIGPTSDLAARKLGFTKVYAPIGSKGVSAWAEVIKDVAKIYEI